MSDVSRLHGDAIVALVNGAVVLQQVEGRYRVYVGEVTTAESAMAYPYLVVWPPPANRPMTTLAGYNGAADTTTQITAVGTTTTEALAALDRAATGLVGQRPVIAGRSCGLISQVPGNPPPQRDDRVHTPDGRPVFYAIAQFTLHSTAT